MTVPPRLIAACLALAAILLAPLAVVDVPPLLDYPNHLARACVLAFGAADPVLSAMVAPHWQIIPNLAVDILLPPLLRVLPVHVAGRLLLGVSLLLPVIGTVLYSRAIFGRWHAWPLGACLVSTNGLFLLGFINFQLGVGLALLAGAAWVGGRETRPVLTVLVGMAAGVALFFAHLTGLGFYLVLVGAHEVQRIWLRRRSGASWPRAALPGLVAAALLLGPVALYGASPFSDQDPSIQWESTEDKIVRAAMPFVAYDRPADLAAAALVAAIILACFVAGHMRVRIAGGLALAALTLLFVVAPFGLKGTGYLDARFSVMIGFLGFAVLLPRFGRRTGAAVAAVLLLLFVVRSGRIAQVWAAHRVDLAQLRQVTADVAPGERVLVSIVDAAEAQAGRVPARQSLADGTRLDGHTAALLLIEHHAFWPSLFARPEQQPIALRSPYAAIAAHTVGLPNIRLLTTLAPDAIDRAMFPIGADWTRCYDALLVIEAGTRPEFSLPGLVAVARTDYAALFRVSPKPAPCPFR